MVSKIFITKDERDKTKLPLLYFIFVDKNLLQKDNWKGFLQLQLQFQKSNWQYFDKN